ncbi:MAG: hypothetical protein ABI759_20580 [Candidatus Solibacter sp.]
MRLALLSLAVPVVLLAQDPVEIIRRATETDRRNLEISRSYTYLERQEQRDLDSNGKVKKSESTTIDVTLLEGSRFNRLVARNDQPLSAKEQKIEQERLEKSIADRSKETPEDRARRISEWERKQQKQRDALKELPDAFNFKLLGQESLSGVDTWVVEGLPKPGYRPTNPTSAFFPKVKMKLWIEKQDYRWVRADVESLDTISFAGFLVRVAKGTRVTIETTRINNEVWLPKSIVVRGSVRLALIKLIRGEIIFTYSDYKKFQTDSRVITQ